VLPSDRDSCARSGRIEASGRDPDREPLRVRPSSACGGTGFSAAAGVSYHVLAFDDTPNGTNGGTLQISAFGVVPPEAAVTVDPTGVVNARTGVVTVLGTFTCANAGEFAFLDVTVAQRVGRFIIRGFGEFPPDPCDGQSHPWSLDVTGDNGRFAGGKVTVDAFLFACGLMTCATDEVIQTVRLHGR
jgi:Family of unknown function (DUF6299)